LDILFSRYSRALSLVAYRVLGNHKEAEDAVQNCLRTATDNVPRSNTKVRSAAGWLESLSMKLCYFLASKVWHPPLGAHHLVKKAMARRNNITADLFIQLALRRARESVSIGLLK